MVEIVNKVQAISLNYGTITRDSPIRLECLLLDYHIFSLKHRENAGVSFLQNVVSVDVTYSSF